MKRKIRNLVTSLTTAFVLFMLLAAIFGYGSHLAAVKAVKPIFKKMTATHIWNALDAICQHQAVLCWLLVLAAVAIALFVNTLCCTWQQYDHYQKSSRAAATNKRLRRMVFIHVAALTVIVFHGLDVLMVERHLPRKIAVGSTGELNGYTIKVEAIHYITDKTYIRENEQGRRRPSFKIPSKKFSIKGNKARIGFYKNDRLVETSDIRMFSPVRLGSTFFFLDGFYIPHNSEQIGISIHSSDNPLVLPFFMVYACLFTILLWHACAHWHSRKKKAKDNRISSR